MEQHELYQVLDSKLRIILNCIKDKIHERDFELILEFVDASEYGLALETICDVICTDKISISSDCYLLIVETGEAMQLDPSDNWLGIMVDDA